MLNLESQKKNNVISINGLHRHGFLLSPYLSKKAVERRNLKNDFNLSIEEL